jgi:Amt family ammonium transporter
MILSWIHKRPSVLGLATGAVVGLVAITPAAGFISPIMGIFIGAGAAAVSYYMMLFRARKMKVDESLDVWACHGIGGTFGALATGLFATVSANSAGFDGLFYGNPVQFLKQLLGVAVVWAFSFCLTWVIGKVLQKTIGLRVSPTEETLGLDLSQHGERAYGGMLR